MEVGGWPCSSSKQTPGGKGARWARASSIQGRHRPRPIVQNPPPLLLDLDGTLADTLEDIRASANHVRDAYGLEPLPADTVRELVGNGAMALLRGALQEAGPFEPLRERAWALYREHHTEQCMVHVRAYPGVCEHLRQWHGEGRLMAVVTNKPEAFAAAILDHLELTPHLPVLIAGDTIGHKKPAPEPIWAALDRLGAPRTPAIMAGDSPSDLRAGQAAGLTTIAALYGYRPAEELRRQGADLYWQRFGEEDL